MELPAPQTPAWLSWPAFELPTDGAWKGALPRDRDPAVRSNRDCLPAQIFLERCGMRRVLQQSVAFASALRHKNPQPWPARTAYRFSGTVRRRAAPGWMHLWTG